MVDAQAPGLAERLRALASVPHSGRAGTSRLLEEYALLHLLAVAYHARMRLPPPLRDTVGQDRLQPPPGRRAGRRAADQGPLAGAGPARPRAGPDPDPPDLAARPQDRPGRAAAQLRGGGPGARRLAGRRRRHADADLVFYPGAVPLRAAVLARHDDPDDSSRRRVRRTPLDGRPPDGGTIAGLLDGYAAALAADPLAGQLARRRGDHPGPRPALAVRGADGGSPLHPGVKRLLARYSRSGGTR